MIIKKNEYDVYTFMRPQVPYDGVFWTDEAWDEFKNYHNWPCRTDRPANYYHVTVNVD